MLSSSAMVTKGHGFCEGVLGVLAPLQDGPLFTKWEQQESGLSLFFPVNSVDITWRSKVGRGMVNLNKAPKFIDGKSKILSPIWDHQ